MLRACLEPFPFRLKRPLLKLREKKQTVYSANVSGAIFVLTTFLRHLLSISEQSHSSMESICQINTMQVGCW